MTGVSESFGLSFLKRIEYVLEWKLLEKSVKRPFCCTVSILQAYFIIDQWSFHKDSMPFTLQTMIFVVTLNQMMLFYSHTSFYEVYLTALKNSNLKWIV